MSLTSWGHDFPAFCWPSLGLGNTTGAEILQETFLIDPLLYHAVRTAVRRLTDVSHSSPELRSCRETSGEHCNLSLTSCVCDCPAYCWPSLGLGNTAGAEILPTLVPTVWPVCLYVCLSVYVGTDRVAGACSLAAPLPSPLQMQECLHSMQEALFVASRRVLTLWHPAEFQLCCIS